MVDVFVDEQSPFLRRHFSEHRMIFAFAIDRRVAEGAAFGGAVALALAETFWSQAVAVEVDSLHLLLVSLLLWTFARALRPPDGREEARWWSFFALCTGLAFANHMTTIPS